MINIKFLAVMLLLLTHGCASFNNTDTNVFYTAKSNFNYTGDVWRDTWKMYHTINQPFYGDCEDFAFTLQNAIGGKVMYTNHATGAHAVLLKDGYVYDSLNETPIREKEYPSRLLFEMVFNAQLTSKYFQQANRGDM